MRLIGGVFCGRHVLPSCPGWSFAVTLAGAQATSTLRGVVVREGTDEPLRDAEILVNDYNPQNLTMLESFLGQAQAAGDAPRAALVTSLIQRERELAQAPHFITKTDEKGRFTTFYPNALKSTEATLLKVNAGDELKDINIQIRGR